MKYHVLTMIPFTDIHTKEKYEANKELIVSEERALELFSSENHLVRFLSREMEESNDEIENDNSDKPIDNEDENKTLDNESSKNKTDDYDSLSFKQLEALAKERNLDIVGANSKEKLKELLRNNS